MTRWVVVGLFVLAIPALGAGTAAADETEESFGAFVPEPQLEPGAEQTVTIDLQYRGEEDTAVTNTVGNISAELSPDDPDELDVRTDQQYITSSISSNSTVSTSFTVVADDSLRFADERNDDTTVDTTMTVYYEEGQSTEVDVTLQVEEQAYFTGDADGELQIGEPGTIDYELENVGYESASDVTVDIEPAISGVDVLPPTERSLDELAYGESDDFSVDLEVTDETLAGDVPLRTTVEFEDENGVTQQSRELLTTVPIDDDQQFDVNIDESTLRYGETGTVDLDVENTGDSISDATVQVQSLSSAVTITGGQDEEYIGDWNSDEEHSVSVSGTTDDGTPIDDATFAVTVDYRDDGADRTSRAVISGVDIDSEQRFSADYDGEPLRVGETRDIPVELINENYGDISDAVIDFQIMSPDAELPGGSSEIKVEDWAEGDNYTTDLTVTVFDDAPTDNLPISATVEYETDDGLIRESAPVMIGAEVLEAQDFSVNIDESTLRYGETGTVDLTIENTGDHLDDATVQIQSLSSAVTVTGGQDEEYIGEWDSNEQRSVSVSATTDDGTPIDNATFQIAVEYEDDGADRTSQADISGIDVRSDQRFTAEYGGEPLRVGETRTIPVELTNNQYGNITDAVVAFQVQSPDAELPEGASEVDLGNWDEGTTRTANLTVTVDDDAPSDNLPIRMTVEYKTDDGLVRESAPNIAGVDVLPAQDFTVDLDEATLRVGESSTITGNITNDGEEELSDVILRPEEADLDELSIGDVDNIELLTDNYYIESLDAGESSSFTLKVDVSGDAEPGPRAISLQTDYENPDGDRYTVSPLFASFDVDPERDDFNVEIIDSTVPIDGSETLTIEVTNQLDEDVTDIEAMLYTEDPISSDDDQAFIDNLAAGETATVEFTIDADSTAVEKTYPTEVDFQYKDSDGDTQLSDVYTVPVDVTAEERNWLQIALIFSILLVGGGAIALRYFDALPSLRGS